MVYIDGVKFSEDYRGNKVISVLRWTETFNAQGSNFATKHEMIQSVKNQYKTIFEPFRNQNPITRFFKEYNCEFVPFSTGDYNDTIDGSSNG